MDQNNTTRITSSQSSSSSKKTILTDHTNKHQLATNYDTNNNLTTTPTSHLTQSKSSDGYYKYCFN